MTVGADVLDGGGSGKTGDTAQGFDAGKASFASVGDDIVPWFTTHDLDGVVIFVGIAICLCDIGDAAHAVDDNDTMKTFVVTDGVGTTTKDKNGEVLGGGKFVGFGDFAWLLDFDAIFGGTANAHSSDTRNQNIFTNSHNTILAQNEFYGKFLNRVL